MLTTTPAPADMGAEGLERRLVDARGHEAIEILVQLSAQTLKLEDHEATLAYASQGLMLIESHPDARLEAQLATTLCHSFVGRRDASGARPYCERGLTLAQELRDDDLRASVLNGLGTAYWILGELDQAMRLQFEALSVAETTGNRQTASDALHRIGILYRELGDFDRALASNARAIALREALGDRHGLSATLNNIGTILIHRNELDTAFEYLQRSLALKNELGLDPSRVYPLTHLGRIHVQRREYEKALAVLGQAERIAADTQNRTVIAEIHTNIAAAYRGQGRLAQASASVRRAIAAAELGGARSQLRTAVAEHSQVLAAQGRFREALEEHRRYKTLDDAFRSEQVGRRIGEAQSRHEIAQREVQIAMLQKDQAIRQAETRRQTLLRNSLAGGVFLLGATLALVANRYRLKSRANALISRANVELTAADRIVRDINEELDLARLPARLLERVMALVPAADRGTVLLSEPGGKSLRAAARAGFRPDDPEPPVPTPGDARRRYTHEATALAEDVYLRRPQGDQAGQAGAPAPRSQLILALPVEGHVDGFVVLESVSDADAFGSADAEPLARLRGHVVAGVEKARIMERLRIENEKLKDALAQIDLLGALLPICAGCKMIRDDSGDWHQVESYISRHGGASFTHGICPNCVETLYPGIRRVPAPKG